jgi:hypothetical protein
VWPRRWNWKWDGLAFVVGYAVVLVLLILATLAKVLF